MDKYDKAMQKLFNIENEEEFDKAIQVAWVDCDADHETGCLFQYAGIEGENYGEDGKPIGCLTMIKKNPEFRCAATKELTEAILADDRIPKSYVEITMGNRREKLPAFAELQRRIDKEVRNVETHNQVEI